MKRAEFQVKLPSEQMTVSLDFSSALSEGDSLTGVNSINIQTYMGPDPNVFNMLSGGPLILGNLVTQHVANGLEGNTYILTCIGTTQRGYFPEMKGYITVVPVLS